ncbi:MAG: B12-binding domain-containing radical SAM protein [Thermodesulfobacteriota bacterium]
MKKRVLLLTAPRPEPGYSPLHFGDNRPPQGLGYLAAYISQKGHEAGILDLYAFGGGNVENNPFVNQEEIGEQLSLDLDDYITKFQPNYIGMYIHTMSFEPACQLSRRLKESYPGIKQVCGGPHPTLLPESIPDTFDHVVMGAGEYVLLDIIEGRTTDRVIQGRSLKSDDLERLPWPDFDLFFGKPYNWGLKLFNKDVSPVFTISTSRGCPFRCRFCGVKYIYPHYNTISAQHIFDRMIGLSRQYGVKTFYFREDNFTANLHRLDQFCDLIVENGADFQWVCESRVKELAPRAIAKMARAGCLGLYIGCESGSPAVLERMRKDETVEDFKEKFPILHEHGINTYTTWVYGTPGETSSDRKRTDKLIDILSPKKVDRFVYLGIPRSEFYDQLLSQREYEFMDKSGFIYPKGYLSLTASLYGHSDSRVQYVDRIYSENGVTPIDVRW